MEPSTTEPATERQSILVVDDDEIIFQLVAVMLDDTADAIYAADGATGLQLAEDTRPDLILLDVMMEGLDGYEVCRRLKGNPATRDIPVIFMTRRSTDQDQERGLNLGAIDFLIKPVGPYILKARLDNHLALRRAMKELERMATLDIMTGVARRHHFLAVAEAEVDRVRRYKRTLSVVMFDIDNFKRINDTYGHDVGDIAIIRTTEAARETLRTQDFIGRLGGEEFAVLLPETDLENARAAAERIRRAIAAIVIDSPSGPVTFTCSLGVTAVNADDKPFEKALKRADLALYEAKESGRNKVVAHHEKPAA